MRKVLSRRQAWGVVAALAVVGPAVSDDWTPPEPALSRKEYEAQYPKRSASAAALEIAEPAGRLGIDASPDGRPDSKPEAEAAASAEAPIAGAGQYVAKEIQDPSDAVAPPPKPVARRLDGNSATLASLIAAASGRRESIAFDGQAPGTGEPALNLPSSFRAAAPPRRTPTPKAASTPTPTPGAGRRAAPTPGVS